MMPSSSGGFVGNNKWFVKGNLWKNCDTDLNADSRCFFIGKQAVLYKDVTR